jgi:hypothetical protein
VRQLSAESVTVLLRPAVTSVTEPARQAVASERALLPAAGLKAAVQPASAQVLPPVPARALLPAVLVRALCL